MTTKLMIRFESMASWIFTPVFDVWLGTNRKVSKPSNKLRKAWSFPSGSKFGLTLLRYFLRKFILFSL